MEFFGKNRQKNGLFLVFHSTRKIEHTTGLAGSENISYRSKDYPTEDQNLNLFISIRPHTSAQIVAEQFRYFS